MTRPFALALGLGVALAAGCASLPEDAGSGTDAAPATTAAAGTALPLTSVPEGETGPNPPPVRSFDAPETVSCTPGGTTNVTVTYETGEAMVVTFMLDMVQIRGYPPQSGSFDVPVPCDGKTHELAMFAVGNDASTTTRIKRIRAGA